ncbi:MAG: hypothetical protein GYB24_04475 [Rhodobacteraceae bacterium]|nr:hypothetical protein [Paracoccaceae bacterium]
MNVRNAVAVLCILASPALGDQWTAQKCSLYQIAFRDAVGMLGDEGLREVFLQQNEAFITSGCTEQGHVCAKTPQEIKLADLLTVMTMNEGMASTFVPFGCKPAP